MQTPVTPQNPDFLTRVISTIVPAVVAETAKRYGSDNWCAGGVTETHTYVDKIAKDITEQCQFNCDDDPSSADETNHIQNLKMDLHHLYGEFMDLMRDEMLTYVREELRDEIKMELRMEMWKELEGIKKRMDGMQVGGTTQSGASGGTQSGAKTATLQSFNFDVGKGGGIKTVSSGYESIASTNFAQTRAPKTKAEIEEELMKTNPMFARVNSSLSRQGSGQVGYSDDAYLEARKDRMDEDAVAAYKSTVAKSRVAFDEGSGDEEEDQKKWDRLYATRFNTDK
jgi:hypothetical protein